MLTPTFSRFRYPALHLSQDPIPTPPYAECIQPLALEDDLLHSFLPVVALAAQNFSDLHPADFFEILLLAVDVAFVFFRKRSDHKHRRAILTGPLLHPLQLVDVEHLRSGMLASSEM